MLAGWDKLQDLRRQIAGVPPQQPDVTKAVADAPDNFPELAGLTDRVTAYRVVKTMEREGKRVGKLAEIADRIAMKKREHDLKADDWAKRLDALDGREPEAFAIGDTVLEEREIDLADMERSMRAISNLPNVSGKS